MDCGLSQSEMFDAAITGVRRRLSAIRRKRSTLYGDPNLDLWGLDIESCAAEKLVAKRLGKYWHSIAERPGELPGDAGEFQVRHTPRPDGRLILHPFDKPESVYILVVGHYPALRIVGWIKAIEGQQPEYWWEQTGRPAFFVPQSALHPMEQLWQSEKSTSSPS